MPCDVVTFGEAMVRLSPPGGGRVELATTFDVQVGGAELNAAAGLAQLGRSAAWVSRLTANPLGRLIAGRARQVGVDVDAVVWTDADRVGLFVLEVGAAPRPSAIVYDRRDSAFARLAAGTVPWPDVFRGAKWVHVSGISAAVNEAATREALAAARAAGLRVSFDPNYRAKLWDVATAARVCSELLAFVDVLITTEGDAERLFGVGGDGADVVGRRLTERYGVGTVAFTRRSGAAVWHDTFTAEVVHGGRLWMTRTYDVEVVDRIGAGDAFAAGLIHGLLDDDVQKGLDWGAALAALKHTIPGDFVVTTPAEVEAVVAGEGLRVRR